MALPLAPDGPLTGGRPVNLMIDGGVRPVRSRGGQLADRVDDQPHTEDGERVRDFLPCSYGERTGDFASVVRWSDFYTDRELRNVPLFVDYWGTDGTRYGLYISLLPCQPEHRRKICFWRSSGADRAGGSMPAHALRMSKNLRMSDA